MMNKTEDRILIYNDKGTECTDILRASVLRCLPSLTMEHMQVHFVNAEVLSKNWEWFEGTQLLIIPGGRDLPYVDLLSGPGNVAIREFVKRGGSYLGLCAGAYYASCYCDFERGTELEVCGKRELSLCPGTALGCVYPGFSYGSCDGARVVRTAISGQLKFSKHLNKQRFINVYYNGGCEFIINKKSTKDVEILAYYEEVNKKVAITFNKFGLGTVVLSGVHPEMHFEFLNKDSYSMELWNKIKESSDDQTALFTSLLSLLV